MVLVSHVTFYVPGVNRLPLLGRRGLLFQHGHLHYTVYDDAEGLLFFFK